MTTALLQIVQVCGKPGMQNELLLLLVSAPSAGLSVVVIGRFVKGRM